MKKCFLIVSLIYSAIAFSQTITSKQEETNAEQYELLKKVNESYPDITLNKTITNFYADGKIIDSQQEFKLKGTKFSSYKLGIEPDNKKLLFEYATIDSGKVYGDVTIFKGNALRTTYYVEKGEVEFSINGKAVFAKKF